MSDVLEQLGSLSEEELRKVKAAAAALLEVQSSGASAPLPEKGEDASDARDLARFVKAAFAGAGVRSSPPPVAQLAKRAPRDHALLREAWAAWRDEVDAWVLGELRSEDERRSYLMRYRWRLVAVAAARARRVLREADAPVSLRTLMQQMRAPRVLLDAALPGYPPAVAVRLAAAAARNPLS